MMDYSQIQRTVLDEPDDHSLFQQVSEHIACCLGERFWELDQNTLSALPEAPRTIAVLWRLAAEVAGNGFEVYLLDRPDYEIMEAWSALKRVRASELLELFEAGIPLAREAGADFTEQPRSQWFSQFARNPNFASWDSIDDPAYELAGIPFSSICAEYIRKQGEML